MTEVTITHEPEPDAESLHDAVTAAVVEAEHRETVEETLEEIQGEQETWQSEMLEMQARTLSALTGMEATLSMLTIQQEQAAMAQASEASSETPADISSPAPGPVVDGPVEEVVLVAPPPSNPDDEPQSSSSPETGKSKFYSPLRNLLRARKQQRE